MDQSTPEVYSEKRYTRIIPIIITITIMIITIKTEFIKHHSI